MEYVQPGGTGDGYNVNVDVSALRQFAREVYTVYLEEIEPQLNAAEEELVGSGAVDNDRRGGGETDGARTLGKGGGEYAGTEIGKYHANCVDDGVKVLKQTVEGLLAAAYGAMVFAQMLSEADGEGAQKLSDDEMNRLWEESTTGAGAMPPGILHL